MCDQSVQEIVNAVITELKKRTEDDGAVVVYTSELKQKLRKEIRREDEDIKWEKKLSDAKFLLDARSNAANDIIKLLDSMPLGEAFEVFRIAKRRLHRLEDNLSGRFTVSESKKR